MAPQLHGGHIDFVTSQDGAHAAHHPRHIQITDHQHDVPRHDVDFIPIDLRQPALSVGGQTAPSTTCR